MNKPLKIILVTTAVVVGVPLVIISGLISYTLLVNTRYRHRTEAAYQQFQVPSSLTFVSKHYTDYQPPDVTPYWKYTYSTQASRDEVLADFKAVFDAPGYGYDDSDHFRQTVYGYSYKEHLNLQIDILPKTHWPAKIPDQKVSSVQITVRGPF